MLDPQAASGGGRVVASTNDIDNKSPLSVLYQPPGGETRMNGSLESSSRFTDYAQALQARQAKDLDTPVVRELWRVWTCIQNIHAYVRIMYARTRAC